MNVQIRAALLTTLLVLPGNASAEPHHCHGMQMFDATRLPPEPVRSGIGTSDFTITTRVPKARQMMQQGIALLHDFWHFEAYRSFLEVVRLDPKSPMGYFGLHLVYKEFGKAYEAQAKAQLDEALKHIEQASEHERYYLRAAKAQRDKDDHAYHREMSALIDRFPDDIDAKLFLAAHLQDGYDDEGRPNDNQLYGQAILESLLVRHPDHVGANHYFVHALEGSPHPQTALAAAEKLPRLAPSSAHLVHMPGHIYYRLGNYAKARQAFEAAMRVDEAYLADEHVRVADDWNYPHNLAYLIATCAEDGRYAEGQRLARKLENVGNEPSSAASAYAMPYTRAEAGDFALARLQMRYGDWSTAANNPLAFPIDEAHVDAQAKAYRDGLRSYIAGMNALTSHRLGEAAQRADALDAALWQLQRVTQEDAPRNVQRVLGLASYDLRANVAARDGHLDDAVKLMLAARKLEAEMNYSEPPQFWRPIDESFGKIYLDAHKWKEAREAFAHALLVRPESGFALSGLGAAEAGAGNTVAATAAYAAALKTWSEADPDLPATKEARAWLAAHQK